MSSDDKRPLVVCLVPARNAAHYLPQWFDSVARFADAVVALDDGSTDGTGDLLAANPLVEILLRNPPRGDHAGWNDSVNRNRLLEAAAALKPNWIISVDADELVPREDGEALRRFIDEEAVAGIAYGFPLYRMIEDVEHYDVRENWSCRLFAYSPRHVFPEERLHFMPVPTSIPRSRWLVTNLRIQHLNGLTPERRRSRRQKYREVDPDRRWAQNYSYIDAPPGELKVWPRRRAGQPVLLEANFANSDTSVAEAEVNLDGPVLSVVLIVDEGAIDDMVDVLDAITSDDCRYPLEIIVLARDAEIADDVARLRPGTAVVVMQPWSSAESCRNVGLRVARGDYVVFFDAPATVEPGALNAIVDAHDQGCAIVSGELANLTRSVVGWASYFDDPGRCSFAREPLLRSGGFDERMVDGIEARARDRLVRDGQRPAHTPLVTFGHRTSLRTAGDYLSQRFARGRATAKEARRASHGRGLLPTMVRFDSRRIAATLTGLHRCKPDAAESFQRVRTLVLGGVLATWAGAGYEQLRAMSVVPRRDASVRR